MASTGVKRQLEDISYLDHIIKETGVNSSYGSKKRCTNYASSGSSRSDNSPFRDPSTLLAPLNDDIANVITEELNRKNNQQSNSSNNANDNQHANAGNGGQITNEPDEKPTLTVRQTHLICEKLVKDREQRLREEYDRVLVYKLAEQYDLIAKANYINPYAESSRLPTALSPPVTTPSLNAVTAAFTSLHRSGTPVNKQTGPPIPDLSSFAVSLSANGHPSALATSQLAYNLQQQAAATAALQAQQAHRAATASVGGIPVGPVLLASQLDEQLATPEALFTLFGVFGDVVRVKILFNKKDNALVQMADANQAQVAQGYLDKLKVFGKSVRVTRSKHQLVQMPRDGNQSDAGLTKDFTNSPLHRFKIPGSRNYNNIYPPSNTLHISNIPATIDEKDLHDAFKEACGFEFSSFKFFPKDRKMALMKFVSIEHATIALIKMHNFQISDENSLRVSFSKSGLQQ